MSRHRRIARAVWVGPFLALGAACSDGPTGPSEDELVTRFLSSGFVVIDAQEQTFTAELSDDDVPTDGTEPFPALTFGDGPISAVRGGSIVIGMDSPTPVERIFVGVAGQEGSYEIALAGSQALRNEADGSARFAPAGSGVVAQVQYARVEPGAALNGGQHLELVLAIPNDASLNDFELSLAVDYGAGGSARASAASRSRVTTRSIKLIDGGSTASLSFTIKWEQPVDVDLHVITPSRTRIGYDHREAEGGSLSVDTNAGCLSNPGTTEKIEWATGTAPRAGVYAFGPNYYEACDGLQGDVPVTITLNNGRVQGVYRVVLQRSDANNEARLDVDKTTYTAVLAPRNTEQGLLARLMIHENPPPGVVSPAETTLGMEAVRAVVYNRLGSKNPHITLAPENATLEQIITARNQFQGFSGGMTQKTEEEVDRRLVAFSAHQALFKPYWDNLFSLLETPVNDPFKNVTQIGQAVMPGAWAMFATSELERGSRGPGGAFIAIPRGQNGIIAGNQYYTLPANFR